MIIHTKEKPSPLCAECGKDAENEKLVLNVRQLVWVHSDCLQSYLDRTLKADSLLGAKIDIDSVVVFE